MGRMARTPTLSGITVARELLLRGLSTDGRIVQGTEGSDIIRWRTGRRTAFAIRHPDYVDHVLHDGADRYHKSVEYELLRAALGLNLFTDEDESWRRHRMMLNPVMAKRHLVGLFELMSEPVERWVDDVEARAGDRVEMVTEMTELTLDVVGAALFGRAMGDLARRLQRSVTDALRTAEVGTRLLMVADPPVWTVRLSAALLQHAPYMPPPLDKPRHALRTIDRTVWQVIHERKADPVEHDDLLGLLLRARDEEGGLSMRRVRDEATTFMLAGHETTANALSWMWYLLALNVPARDRLLAEVDEVLGDRLPTVADLPRLPWTTACFQEAMRFFPPAWAIPRVCVADDEIDGHRIPKGATVLIPIHAIHHDPRVWDEPERYDPSRFLPENARGRHRSAYLPFGGGRRICIGSSFALMEGTLIAAAASRRFVFDLVPGHPVEPEATLTLRPRSGVKMIVHRRGAPPAAAAA
jgi:cytochrome P450